jgi:hypothetical protein
MPIPKHGEAVGQVVDGVDADDRVERLVVERSGCAASAFSKRASAARPSAALVRRLDRMGVDVDADDASTGGASEVEIRTAEPQATSRTLQPNRSPRSRMRCATRRLSASCFAEVVPVGLQPHLAPSVELERLVGGVVELHLLGGTQRRSGTWLTRM